MKTQISISSHKNSMRVPRKRIAALVQFVAKAERVKLAYVDIAVVGSRQIAAMNRKYLQHPGPTDVISFDLSDELARGVSCQLVVCSDVARKQAEKLGLGVQKELLLYITHGLLHMLNYDDTTPAKAKKMYARQEELLERFFNLF